MYLTCVDLDLARRQTFETVASPYKTHAAIEGSFSQEAVREDGDCRILWRLDDGGAADCARLYIVSPEPPLASELSARFETELVGVRTKDYRTFVSRIEEGGCWRFRLKANPVRRVLVDKGRRPHSGIVGSVQGHVTVSQQLDWLASRTEVHGFVLLNDASDVVVSHRSREVFRRGEKNVTLSTAQFDGILRVEDAARFRQTLGFGIGRAKGFGCGLMTIVPC